MKLKKVLLLLVVALLIYYIISQPTSSASAVNSILSWLGDAAQSVITFIQTLFA